MNVAVYFAQILKIFAQIMANFSALGMRLHPLHPHAVRLCLPVLSLLCAWTRHLKTRTQRSQAICTSVLSLLKLLLIKKYIILILNTLHLYPAKTNKDSKTNKERVTGFLYKALELPTSDFRFLQKAKFLTSAKFLGRHFAQICHCSIATKLSRLDACEN